MIFAKLKVEKMARLLEAFEKEFEHSPAGTLYFRKPSYYQVIDGKELNINGNITLIMSLARKKLLKELIKQFRKNIKFFPNERKMDLRSAQVLIASMAKTYTMLPLEYFLHPSAQPFLKQSIASFLEEQLKHHSKKGEKFRSKSERDLADALDEEGYLFKYERPLSIKGKTIRPDFTLMHPYYGYIQYLEHFGALHLPEYVESMFKKMRDFRQCGYIENVHIKYTFEVDTEDPRTMRKMLRQFMELW